MCVSTLGLALENSELISEPVQEVGNFACAPG